MSRLHSGPIANHLVLIPKRIVEDIRDQRRKYLPRETGGFLIGLRRQGHLEIVDFTAQQREDSATPVSFRRDDPGHADAILAAWERSGQFLTLIGDWHSHPIGNGSPSSTDIHAWRTLSRWVKGPVVGVIAAEGAWMRLFLLPHRILAAKARELHLVEDGSIDLVFGLR